MSRTRESLPPGIRRREGRPGYEARVRLHHGPGGLRSKGYPEGTAPSVMLAWIETQRASVAPPPEAGSLAAAVADHLSRITAQPTYKQKAAHLALWLAELGAARTPASVTASEIDQAMQRWLVTPSKPAPGSKGRPSGAHGLDPETVRKRKTTLQSFYVMLNGKAGYNPARGSHPPAAKKPETRGLDMVTLQRILAAMPAERSVRRGHAPEAALAKVRATVIAFTGLPPGLLGALTPADLDLVAGTVRVSNRTKGGGVAARTLDLTAPGLAALRAFHEAGAYGHFSEGAVCRSFKKAAKRIGIDPATVRLYDARHAFLAELYRQTRDEATVARFAMHAEGSVMTARYTRLAHETVDRAAAAAFTLPVVPEAPPVVAKRPKRGKVGKVGRHGGPKLVKRVSATR